MTVQMDPYYIIQYENGTYHGYHAKVKAYNNAQKFKTVEDVKEYIEKNKGNKEELNNAIICTVRIQAEVVKI